MKTEFLKYDAQSIQDLLSQKLIQSGLVGDTIYPGSDVRIIMDLFSWTFGVLTYILNNTASNTIFDDVQVYQNLNKIVKLLSYNPQSYKTSFCQFLLENKSLPDSMANGTYTIPRFAYIDTKKINQNGDHIYYSFASDFQFTVTDGVINNSVNPVLYNGRYYLYTFDELVQSLDFETFTMRGASPNGQYQQTIDRTGFTVFYEKVNQAGVSQITQIQIVDNLILDATKDDLVCQVKLNQNKQLVVKFGNGIHGKKLESGGTLYAVYLVSDEDEGIIDANEVSNFEIQLGVNRN